MSNEQVNQQNNNSNNPSAARPQVPATGRMNSKGQNKQRQNNTAVQAQAKQPNAAQNASGNAGQK